MVKIKHANTVPPILLHRSSVNFGFALFKNNYENGPLGGVAYGLFISNTYCCWAESLLLAQISMMYYESAPKKCLVAGFIGQSDE